MVGILELQVQNTPTAICVFWDINLDSQVCMENNLSTEPFPQAQCFCFSCFCISCLPLCFRISFHIINAKMSWYFLSKCVGVYVYMCVCECVRMYLCVCVCVFVYVCVCLLIENYF